MKILLVAPSTLPARRANTVQVMKMSQGLRQHGLKVHLAVPHPALRRSFTLVESGEWRAGSSKRIVDPPVFGSPASPLASWDELAAQYGIQARFPITWLPARPGWRGYDFAWRSLWLARRCKADLLYTRVFQTAALASQLGRPTVLEVHDYPPGRTGPWLFKKFLKGTGAQRLAVITRALAEDLKKKFALAERPNFLVIAPDGVDLDRFKDLPGPREARRRLAEEIGVQLPVDGFVAGFTGHLYPGRGRELLLDLAARLPTFTFLVVGGEPDDVAELRALAQATQADNLRVIGFVPNRVLPLYQAACDALLMPYQRNVSASSGGDIGRYFSPMKLFEYLAAGRPVVSSDLPVLREVLTDQNCLLVPPDDSSAWTDALVSLQSRPALGAALAAQALRDVQGYTWENRASRIFDVLAGGVK